MRDQRPGCMVLYLGQPTGAAVAGFDYIQTDDARVVNK